MTNSNAPSKATSATPPDEYELRPRLLLVDDEPTNLQVLRHALQSDYRLLFTTDGTKALDIAQQQQPDLILLDVMMPNMNGYTVCRHLKADPRTAHIPVLFVTAMSDMSDEAQGFEAGAVDYIVKPIRAPIVRARVQTHLSLVRLDELRQSRLEIVQRLGRAAEYKDNETGMHVLRMSHYAYHLALAAGATQAWADDMLHAAPMHDVGKIGIPDFILHKPGPLNEDEWAVMRKHPEIGGEIIGEHPDRVLRMARSIALAHHEKWDGTGYPKQLKAEEIPLEARIVALADVFDALTARRPYKEPWPIEKAVSYIQSQATAHFDPHLVDLFVQLLPTLLTIRERWAEH